MNRTRTLLVFSGLALVAGALWYLRSDTPRPSTPNVEVAEAKSLWPAGFRHRYRFEYTSEESVRPLADVGRDRLAASDAISGAIRLSGELVLEAPLATPSLISLQLEKLEVAELSVGGQVVPDPGPIWQSGQMAFTLGPRGTFGQYQHTKDANPLLVQTLRALGMRLQVAGPKSPSETRFEIGEELPHGLANSVYEEKTPGHWVRTRTRYENLDVARNHPQSPDVELSAEAKIGLDQDHRLETLEDVEAILVKVSGIEVLRGTSKLHLQHLESLALVPSPLVLGAPRPLSELPTSDQLAAKLSSERTGGMTRASAVALLARHMNGGKLPDHRRALWQLTGVLEAEPQMAKDLASLFLQPSTNSEGRALLLDILVSVGHEDAQEAVRTALDSEQSRTDPSRSIHFQRLGLIDTPTIETLRFAARALSQAQASGGLDARVLGAYTAAAVAGHARESDDPTLVAEANAIGTTVSGLLAAAATPAEQRHLIKALYNVKDERFQAQISAFSRSPNDGVRQSVARALREPPTADGTRTLISLIRDRDPFVQTEAIRALEKHALRDGDWDTITAVIRENGLHRRNHRILLDFVKYRRDTSREATTRLLETMLTQKLEGEVAGAVRLLLST